MRTCTTDAVVGYLRCSTQEQADSGLGLAAQRRSITAYADLYGLRIAAVVEDAGASGRDLDRPGMALVLRQLERGEAAGVIVARLDRLSRSVRDVGDLVDRYFGRGLRLVSVGEQVDTSTAAGRLVLHVLASVGQWERETIGERTAAALAAKRARGEVAGTVPVGFRSVGGRLVPDPVEAAAVARVLELRAAGLSHRAIAEALNDAGVPARGQRWHATTVARLLRRHAEHRARGAA